MNLEEKIPIIFGTGAATLNYSIFVASGYEFEANLGLGLISTGVTVLAYGLTKDGGNKFRKLENYAKNATDSIKHYLGRKLGRVKSTTLEMTNSP